MKHLETILIATAALMVGAIMGAESSKLGVYKRAYMDGYQAAYHVEVQELIDHVKILVNIVGQQVTFEGKIAAESMNKPNP